LGVGQGVKGVGQLSGLGGGLQPGLELRQLVGVVVELDPKLSARRQLEAAAAMMTAHEIAGNAEHPAARRLVAGPAKSLQAHQPLGNVSAVRSAAVAMSGV
jgi:hypothetical protein